MAPESQTYFDYYQSRDLAHEPLASDGYLLLQAVYDFEVLARELNGDEAAHILDGQAQLWGRVYAKCGASHVYVLHAGSSPSGIRTFAPPRTKPRRRLKHRLFYALHVFPGIMPPRAPPQVCRNGRKTSDQLHS